MLVTGITDVGDLIQRLPSMSGSPIGTTTNNGGNGSVTIDLRGIGAGRTLNLINGRRTVDGGDYQTIPAAMIERIEILKDGGAAAYGADAVQVLSTSSHEKTLMVPKLRFFTRTGLIPMMVIRPGSALYLEGHGTTGTSL